MSEPGFAIRAEDQPGWGEIVRRAERGESVAVIAHGDHVADVVPSGELDRLRETIEVLSDTELVRDLQEGLADARAGRVFSAGQVATSLYEHLVGPVTANPHRLGKPLDVPFEDVLSTRRGEYRALYTVDERTRVVTVLAVAYRRDAYRPR